MRRARTGLAFGPHRPNAPERESRCETAMTPRRGGYGVARRAGLTERAAGRPAVLADGAEHEPASPAARRDVPGA